MYTYSMTQWLAFFFIYCFFGWCFESVYVSVHEHRWVNRGFMTGPYIPLYGSGAVLMLFLTIPVRGNYLLMYIVGAIGATVLEYITGTVMENLLGSVIGIIQTRSSISAAESVLKRQFCGDFLPLPWWK